MKYKLSTLCCTLALSTAAMANTPATTSGSKQKTLKMPTAQHTQTMNLLDAYLAAKKEDMQYQSATATYYASRYEVPIAYADLLPSLTVTGGYKWTKTKYSGTTTRSHGSNYALTLNQDLFNFGAWKAVDLAHATVKSDTATFVQAAQDLIHNVTNAYFTVLLDQDQLRFAKQNELALKQQYQQIKAQYAVGTKAQSDLQSAKASLASATASRVADENALSNAKIQLTVITNKQNPNLLSLKPNIHFPKPEGAVSQWIQYGLTHNPSLVIAKANVEVAKGTIYATYGGASSTGVPGYLPTVSATANATGDKTLGSNSLNGTTDTQSVGINVKWNLYQGGITQNTIKQDQYNYQAALDNAQEAEREAKSNIKQDYRNVLSDLSQIKAYEEAVEASEVALNATRAAYNAGTRTIVDLLTEQSDLYQAQQNYAKAVNQYITDSLQLKADAGTLTIKDVKNLNGWLG